MRFRELTWPQTSNQDEAKPGSHPDLSGSHPHITSWFPMASFLGMLRLTAIFGRVFFAQGGRSHPACRGTSFARVDVFAGAAAQAFGASGESARPRKLSSVCPDEYLPFFPPRELCGFNVIACLNVVHAFFFLFHKYFNRRNSLEAFSRQCYILALSPILGRP